mmetsp:Transcript_86003/g.151906  ORF Transcript_86003/g.151906 Transcript_86003/m.151906 type:complete len:253 (+) Transcript_86003:91-849(+)
MTRIYVPWSAITIAAACVYVVESNADCPADSLDNTDHPNGAALLQVRTTRETPEKFPQRLASGTGSIAPLNNAGYVTVANTRDPQQMKAYVLRLVNAMGLQVRDHAGLLGVIPFYDGEKAIQSFASLKDELLRTMKYKKGWVTAQSAGISSILQKNVEEVAEVSGAAVPLTEDGYSKIARQNSTSEMVQFVARVVADLGLCIEDQGGISGVALWYSGEKGTQSLASLRSEVVNASKHDNSWILPPPCKRDRR